MTHGPPRGGGAARLWRPAVLALLLAPGGAAAQLPNASAAAFGVGDLATARARGFAAVASNPAGLALPGAPGFSLSVLPLLAEQGLAPVDLAELDTWEGRVVPRPVRLAWLDDILATDGERGSAGAAVSLVALSAGRIGFQLSTIAFLDVRLNEDAAELVLFGNAGRTGQARDFHLAGSSMSGHVVTTAAVAYALPVPVGRGRAGAGQLALGATVKLSVGHAVLIARDVGSTLGSDPLQVELSFPVLANDTGARDLDQGRGVGLDLGAAWSRGPLSLGLSLQNVVNTFAWELGGLSWRPGTALFDQDTDTVDFEERPATEAPAMLVEALERLTFEPVVALGGGLELGEQVTLSADVRHTLGDDGIRSRPDSRLGLGVELRPRSWVALRGGVAGVRGGVLDGTGVQLAGGLGVTRGRVHLDGGMQRRWGDVGDATLAMVALSLER